MTKSLFILVAALLIFGGSFNAKQKPNGTLSFNVIDRRKVIDRHIDENLLLRVVKASSIKQADFGWDVEVVAKSPNETSFLNLLYHGQQWHGPHPSQVYAWHVGERLFRNERELEVRGHSYVVSIVLINPVVEGEGLDRRFISGKIKGFMEEASRGTTPAGASSTLAMSGLLWRVAGRAAEAQRYASGITSGIRYEAKAPHDPLRDYCRDGSNHSY